MRRTAEAMPTLPDRPVVLRTFACALAFASVAATPDRPIEPGTARSRATEPGTARFRATAPGAPPDGTYVYELSRNGTVRGRTTVVVLRRDERRAIELDEAGAFGEARVHVVAAYRYDDLGLADAVVTYQAPFPKDAPLGESNARRPHVAFGEQQTLRYRTDGAGLSYAIDGVRGERRIAAPEAVLFDAPFMATPLMLPAVARERRDAPVLPVSPAFATDMREATPRRAIGAAAFPNTPKTDTILQVPDVADLWFDRGNFIVHEAHFAHLNVDARLVSYARATEVAPFEPAPTPTPKPKLDSADVTIASEDGTVLAGVVSRAPGETKESPAIVLVPPGAGEGRNFGGEGPDPMYPDLALAFASRGYAVVRYDARGVGKSGGSRETESWEQSLADAEAAERFAQEIAGVDPKRVYALGYGTGADLALASAATGNESEDLAGIVALAPTTIGYRACASRLADATKATVAATRTARVPSVWEKTALAHDPLALAARGSDPVLAIHPGVGRCAESTVEVTAYDDRLRATNARATIVAASDLTVRFGGRFDADAPTDTQAFFPYRFDASTASAIADWLDSPKAASARPAASRAGGATASPTPRRTPPPPPGVDPSSGATERARTPRPNPVRSVEPGQVQTPSTFGATAPPTTSPATPPSPKT